MFTSISSVLNLRFSDISRGYRSETLIENGLSVFSFNKIKIFSKLSKFISAKIGLL